MKHTVDLSKYQIRTDLIIENIDNSKKDSIKENNSIKVTKVKLDKNDSIKIGKKEGNYITIEFEDVTDSTNELELINTFKKYLKLLLKDTKIKNNASCLVVGLGNIKSTPDSLGPLVVEKINVTRHMYILNELSPEYRCISSFIPGVTGNTGIETSELIKCAIKSAKPDFLIVIDALASSSIERVNKTIQMSNTGINPGSGIGNSREEISVETVNIPVIAIGIPTVVDAVSVVSDTINYMHKHYAFSKKFANNPINKLVSIDKINYLKKNVEIKNEDKENLLGLVGSLSNNEIRQLIFEVLTPIGYNLMVTPKEIDFVIKKLSDVLSNGINQTLNKKTIL